MLILTGILPLLVFSLGDEYLDYREDIVDTGSRTLALARSMTLLVEAELQARVEMLQTLAASSELRNGDLTGFRGRAEAIALEQYPKATIELLTRNGQEIVNTGLPLGAPLAFRTNLESMRQVFATDRPAVSNLFNSAVGSHPVVAIDVPVRAHDGSVTYVLSLHPLLATFAEVIRRQHSAESWVVSLFDRRGVMIVRVPNGDRFVGRAASPALLDALQTKHDGVESASFDGRPLLWAFSHGGRFGWAVAIGIPRAELNGPVVAKAVKTLAGGGILLVVSLLLAVFAARDIAAPIASLRRLAAAPSRDAFPAPLPTGLPEVDEVAGALYAAEDQRRRSRQAEVILRDGIDAMPEGFVIYDGADRLVICNESYRSFYPAIANEIVPGIRFEEVLRAGVARGWFVNANGREEEWIAEQLRQQHGPQSRIEVQLADGRWVLVRKYRCANGYVVGLRIDITTLKAAEQALRDREEQLKRAQRIAHIGSDMRNMRTDKAEWSDETYRIFGVSRDAYVTSTANFLRMVHPDDRAVVLATRDEISRGICPEPFEYRIIRPDGGVRHLYRENELVFDEFGHPLYMAGTIQDVTESRAAQAREKELERQLMHSQKLEALGTLAGGVAHDLNNTLVPILALSKLALEELPEANPVRADIEVIRRASERARDLVKQVLAFSRKQDFVREMVDLAAVTREAVQMLRASLPATIRIDAQITAVPALFGDAGELHQAVINLATNASQAIGAEAGTITVRVWSPSPAAADRTDSEATVYLSVADTGCGMDAAIRERIFEPFFTTKPVGQGTGLGLSMVHGIVTRHGGSIDVRSRPGEGSEITITLPALARPKPRPKAESAALRQAEFLRRDYRVLTDG